MRNTKIFLVIFFILVISGLVAYSATFNDCKKLYMNYQFDKSSSCFYSLISQDRQNALYKLYYGNSLYEQKRFNEAKVQFSEILGMSTSSAITNMAKRNLDLTNSMLKTISKSGNNDSGTYLSDIRVAKWDSMPIKVWIQPGEYSAYAKRAFNQWQSGTRATVRFIFVQKPSDAKIIVSFKNNISNVAPGDALGVTRTALSAKEITFAYIDIKTTTRTGQKQSAAQIYPVILHEVGHALGIRGHSSNKYDVMYPSSDNYRNTLSKRDLNTILSIYK